jgi:hypothetical protein
LKRHNLGIAIQFRQDPSEEVAIENVLADLVRTRQQCFNPAQSEVPRSVEELDLEIARGVAEVTENFDPKEIERLRLLVHPVLQ